MFGTGGDGFTRLNLACPRPTLDEALDRLEAAVARLRDSRPGGALETRRADGG